MRPRGGRPLPERASVALLLALLSTAAIVYAMPLGRRPVGFQDEARVILLAQDTLRHGLRLPARVRDEPYLNKPPLFFWTVALAALPAGHASDRNAPIPSIVAALVTLLGVFVMGRQLSGIQTGFVALAVLGSSPGFFLHSHEAVPDMMFAAWLTWALVFLLRGLESLPPRLTYLVGFYLCVAGALWTKGLASLMVIPAAMAAVAVTVGVRKLVLFRPVTGLALVALTALPWIIPYARTPENASSQAVSVRQALFWYLHDFRRYSSIPFQDGLLEFLPWTLWLIPAAIWWRLTPDRQAYRPVLAWTAMLLLFLGLGIHQRGRYMLPVLPLFALFVAASVTAAASRAQSLLRIHAALLVALLITVPVAGGWILASRPIAEASVAAFLSAAPWERWSLGGLVIVGPAIALWALRVHRSPSRALSWIAATLALVLLLGAGIYSTRQTLTYPIRGFVDHVRPSLERDAPIIAYPDGHLVFDLYLDRSLVEVPDRDTVARRLEDQATGVVFLRRADWASWRGSVHPSWCSIGEVTLENRSYVLLGSCR